MDIDKTRKKILRMRQCYNNIQMSLDEMAHILYELEKEPEIVEANKLDWLNLGQEILRRTMP